MDMEQREVYWTAIEPIWDDINIDNVDSFHETFQNVRRELGVLYAAHFCQSEVCNGGFTQFFWNSTGVLAPEAVEGFVAIGQLKVADLVGRAMSMLGSPYPRDRAARWAALDGLRPGTDPREALLGRAGYRRIDLFGPFEDDFYSLLRTDAGGFESAADRYAAALISESVKTASKHEALANAREVLSKPGSNDLKSDLLRLKTEIAEMRKRLAENANGDRDGAQS